MSAETTFPGGPGPNGVPRRRFVDRGRRTVGIAVFAGLTVTVAVSVLPELKFAYRSDELHVAIETAAFLVPALAALLFAGRAVRAQSTTDLLVACSLTALAATNLLFSVLPAVIDENPEEFGTWAPAAGRLLGAAGFAAAALLPNARLLRPRRSLALGLALTAAAIALVAILAAVFGDNLPRGFDPDLSPDNAEEPHIEGHALVLGVHIGILLLYTAATVGFVLRAERERDALLLWVAVGDRPRGGRAARLLPVPVALPRMGLRRRHHAPGQLRRAARRHRPRGARLPAACGGRGDLSRSDADWPASCTTASRRSSPSSAARERA